MKALLFDLDGTLLDNPIDLFMPRYFSLLAEEYAPLCPPGRFIPALMEASQAMVLDTDPETTNKDVFWRVFLPLAGVDQEAAASISERFYREQFPRLAPLTRPVPGARELLLNLAGYGCRLVVATNPLFPEQAILERVRWAGLSDLPYALVTSYEKMHCTKPHLAYYREILEVLSILPEDAIMVGNSLEDDMVAKNAGIRTFFIQNGTPPTQSSLVDWQGALTDVWPVLSVVLE